MAEPTPRIVLAADELATALDELREVEGVPLGGGLADLWPDLARSMLARWGVDIRRTAEHAVEAPAQARAEPLTDVGEDKRLPTCVQSVRSDAHPAHNFAQRSLMDELLEAAVWSLPIPSS